VTALTSGDVSAAAGKRSAGAAQHGQGSRDVAAARGDGDEEEEEEEAQLPWPGCTPVKPKPPYAFGCCGCSPGRAPKDHPCCSEGRATSRAHHGIACEREATLERPEIPGASCRAPCRAGDAAAPLPPSTPGRSWALLRAAQRCETGKSRTQDHVPLCPSPSPCPQTNTPHPSAFTNNPPQISVERLTASAIVDNYIFSLFRVILCVSFFRPLSFIYLFRKSFIISPSLAA